MRFSILLTLLSAAVGLATPVGDAVPQEVSVPMEVRDVSDTLAPLDKRACVFNGCKCVKGLRQGQYCGACVWKGDYVISAKRVLKNIYECSPSGACCSYGTGSDCNTGAGRCGPY